MNATAEWVEAAEMPHRAAGSGGLAVANSPGAHVGVRRVQPPTLDDLRRVFPRRSAAGLLGPHSLARTAHHEAGHIVMFEWAGLRPTAAQINESGGTAAFCPESVGTACERPDPDGTVSAMAASVLHAGLAAELLFEGIDPGRVLVTRDSDDWHKASAFLADHFGHPATGAHWYAQRFALHVLSENWARVQEIANHLLEHGQWTPAYSAS